MLKRVTVFFALFCVMAVAGLAQQRVVLSTTPINIQGNRHLIAPPVSGPAGAYATLPYVKPVFGEPGSVLLVPVDTVVFVQRDTSDSAFSIVDEFGELQAFTGQYDFPRDLTQGLGYSIDAPFQILPPMKGAFAVDSIIFFMFKLSDWPDLQGDIFMLPLLAPTNINWNQYQGYRIPLTSFEPVENFTDLIIISKDTINTRLVEQPLEIKPVIVHTPGLVIPANRAFSIGFIRENPADSIRMLGGFEWDQSVKPTGGMMTTVGGTNDTVRSMFGNIQWTAQAPPPLTNQPIRQNFDIRFFGTLEVVTSVTPDPNSGMTGFTLGANYPNPASSETHIRFSIDKSVPAILRLTNMLGQVVETTTFDSGAGSYEWQVNTSHLPTGSYIYSLSIGDRTITRTMTIAR